MQFDEITKEIIMEKLSGAENLSARTYDSNSISMLASLERMKTTAINRSYREIPAETAPKKILRLFKRLIRRLTFWYVEPCMLQQTDYNNANNTLSAQFISEIDNLRSQTDSLLKRIEQLETHNHSYSQSGEDSIIKYILNTLQISLSDCRYLDLGANHAIHLSNTYAFYEKGARGVLVDANPELAEELRRERPEDIVINKCISENSGEKLEFYIMNGDGLSTPDYQSAMKCIKENPSLEITKTVTVDSVSINEIISEYFPDKAPEILNIDIEGNELEILRTIDFTKFRPLIIICEMIEYKNGLTVGQKNREILDFMKSVNYEEFAFTGINSIFTDRLTEG